MLKPSVIRSQHSSEYNTEERCHILEMVGASQDHDVSIARARVEPGVVTAWHRLNGVDERYVITAGSGLVEIGDKQPQAVGAGDVVLIPRGARQRIANVGEDDLMFLCICSPPFTIECYEDLDS